MTKFHVKADHVCAAYAFDGVLSSERADVLGGSAHGSVGYRGDDFAASVEYWASVAGYGCGKSATTPEAAIRILFADNGCTNIRIRREVAAPMTYVEREGVRAKEAAPLEVTIVHRGSDATRWGEAEAFAALNEASAAYPDWAFRLRSGGEVGMYRLEAFRIGTHSTGWLRQEG